MPELILFKGNSMVLVFTKLKNHKGVLIAGALVTVTLYRGTTVVWNGILSPVIGVAGDYEAGISHTESATFKINEVFRGRVVAESDGLLLDDLYAVVVKSR
jgi:hypothetical protein